MIDEIFSKVVQELSTKLKNKYLDLKGIYFFGSWFRGDYYKDSGYDIAIVFNRKIDWKFEDEITSIIYDLELKYNLLLDHYIFNYLDILNPITPLRDNIKNEGIYYAI
jgi:predicted nucleotidyltransferase